MNYIELSFQLNPYEPYNEILIAHLSELGYESFVEEKENASLKAYVLEESFNNSLIQQVLDEFKPLLKSDWDFKVLPKENWNKKWEENFDSVEIGDFCHIRAPFHESRDTFEYEIIIEPKMSFGTGHHQTTKLMIQLMQSVNFEGKKVLDMGSGTGVLAILAKKLGAKMVHAIDIEDWAYENMQENFDRNQVEVHAHLGGKEIIHKLDIKFDIIIANINKNVLLNQMAAYDQFLNPPGIIFLSGFYDSDVSDLIDQTVLIDYELNNQHSIDDWNALKMLKQ